MDKRQLWGSAMAIICEYQISNGEYINLIIALKVRFSWEITHKINASSILSP